MIRFRIVVAYAIWPFIWLACEAWLYTKAFKGAYREYRWTTRGSIDNYKRGLAYIRNHIKWHT